MRKQMLFNIKIPESGMYHIVSNFIKKHVYRVNGLIHIQ